MQELSGKQQSTAVSEDEIQEILNRKAIRKDRITQLLPFIGIVVLIAFFMVTTKGRFLGAANLKLLLNQCFTMVIVMVGAVFLYSLGSMDMALGAVMGVSALVITVLYTMGIPLLISLMAGIATSILFMSVTALAKTKLHVDPFIASLCVMNVCNGIVMAVSKVGKPVFPYSKAPWLNLWNTKIVVLILVVAIGYVLFNYTAYGKSLKAIGGNPMVAHISGIKVDRVTLLAYVTVAVTLGIASLFAIVRGGLADTSVGAGVNLDVMVAVVLGGFPLSGGANAKFSAPIIGALMVTILINGLAMMGQANVLGYAVKGVLFIVVVALTYEKSNGKLIH
jgi:ribose transport system permease protein